jgi:hypothetical protein
MPKVPIDAEIYAVRNKEGKWFRSKGYRGIGNSWVNSLGKAKIYGNITPARRIVTFFATKYPEYGVPDIILLKVIEGEVIDETARVEEAKRKKKEKIEKAELRKRKREFKKAKEQLEKAQKNYEEKNVR